jgi:hypothetical protein
VKKAILTPRLVGSHHASTVTYHVVVDCVLYPFQLILPPLQVTVGSKWDGHVPATLQVCTYCPAALVPVNEMDSVT